MDNLTLNVTLLRSRVPNLTVAAKEKGLRPATVSNLCTGKTPVGRAEVRTLVALAELADCKLDDLIIRTNKVEMIETGIKSVDFLAPVTRGGINGFIARPGMGQLVLLAELFFRFQKKDYTTVLFMPNFESPDLKEVIESSDILCQKSEDVIKEVMHSTKKQDIILAADRSLVITGEIYSLLEKLQLPEGKMITTLLIDPTGEVVDEELPYGPLDTMLVFDAELVSRKRLPAVNPIFSTSIITEESELEKQHLDLLQKARKILRRYRELRFLVSAFGLDKLHDNDKQIYNRGQRLEAYLTQPFFVAEPFTKRKGTFVPLSNTLDDVHSILDGQLDQIDMNKILNIGSLVEITM